VIIEMGGASEEEPRIGVFVCHCGINIGGIVNVPEVVEYAKTIPGVFHAEANLFTCSSDGLSKIKDAIGEYSLNRVVVASCTPRTHEPLFRATCEEAGINKYLFEMANIRDQCSWVHMHEPEKATEKAKDLVRMAVAKALLLKPQEEPEIEVEPSALIIGGGIAGMTAALSLAEQGFKVHIVEKEPEVGGMLRQLYKLFPTEMDASVILSRATDAIKSNGNIEVLTSTIVRDVKGFIGSFDVTIQKEERNTETLRVGTIIVATGAINLEPKGMYGYDEYGNVITQLRLEHLLKAGELRKMGTVVMIQCVGSREERGRTYCSRVCCSEAVKNALMIKEIHPDADVYILHRDLQTYGKEYESLEWRAREKGIKLIRYIPEKPPEVTSKQDGKLAVRVYQVLLGKETKIESDLVVLSTPLIQHEDAKRLSSILKVPLGQDGFFMEAHVKLRPVDFATDGIYVCGTAHGPKNVGESISQALGAASRAAIPMAQRRLRTAAITAEVDENKCVGCGICVELCPYNAIQKDEKGIARVTSAVCKGCGVCGASCPETAITMHNFTNEQLEAQGLAALRRAAI